MPYLRKGLSLDGSSAIGSLRSTAAARVFSAMLVSIRLRP